LVEVEFGLGPAVLEAVASWAVEEFELELIVLGAVAS
jgi:hypothetical protein